MAEPTITVTLGQNGVVAVNGPLENKVLCLGLLEMAKKVVMDFELKRPLIERPTFVPPAGVGGN